MKDTVFEVYFAKLLIGHLDTETLSFQALAAGSKEQRHAA